MHTTFSLKLGKRQRLEEKGVRWGWREFVMAVNGKCGLKRKKKRYIVAIAATGVT
jgi:hypothetical protein